MEQSKCIYNMSGDVSVDEMKKIIDSMNESVNASTWISLEARY